jgi:hypothetical protein
MKDDIGPIFKGMDVLKAFETSFFRAKVYPKPLRAPRGERIEISKSIRSGKVTRHRTAHEHDKDLNHSLR